ncbi:cadherin-like domain-containing protein [Magnetospirillum sulfuroxidans]|uniref:DUF4347 domain-containing protein n=1 Tax=Magnetospirillum sulfuroxidans TaxID=611300 RepID=A0ABS5IA51_9PROT|nr:cadherin-like domain-containing protein [Magnetospirillum sulfuroxidans]MBR9971305.1 DUF4347 domain-containing protein [Magnetospirillum sulfuroxidans]
MAHRQNSRRHSGRAENTHETAKRRPAIGIMALEPRMMFDGAAVVTAIDATTDTDTHDSQHATDANTPDVDNSGVDTPVAIATAAAQPPVREVVFVDSGVTDYQTLVDAARSDVTVVVLDAGSDGLQQISDWLSAHAAETPEGGWSAFHFIGHGEAGTVHLGTTVLNDASLTADGQILADIGSALNADGDILLYGCDIAKGETGQNFIANLAVVTGADIVASDDVTGSAALGGDWTLEAATGAIETASFLREGAAYDGYDRALADYTIDFDSGSVVSGNIEVTVDTRTLVINGSNVALSIEDYNGDGNQSAYVLESNAESSVSVYFSDNAKFDLDGISFIQAIVKAVTWPYSDGNTYTSVNFKIVITPYDGATAKTAYEYTPTVGEYAGAGAVTLDKTISEADLGSSFNGITKFVVQMVNATSNPGAAVGSISCFMGCIDNILLTNVGTVADITAPTVSSVTLPSNSTYKTGDNLDFTVKFDEAVTITGTPRIAITLDTGGTVYADYQSGTGTTDVVFRYTVASGNVDTTGISVGALGLNSGTIKDAAGNVADLTAFSPGSTANVKIDAVAPVFTNNSGGTSVSVNAAENQSAVTTVTTTDATAVTYAITGGADAAKFGLSSGVLTFASPPNYESPTDGGADNIYVVQVTATDAAGNTSVQTLSVTVTDVNESPSVATNTGLSVNQGSTGTITTTQLNEGDVDDAGAGLTYTVTTATTHGSLWIDADGSGTINGAEAALGAGGTFTQQDIIDGKVKYLHDNGVDGADSFGFSLADGGENGATPVTGQTFSFTITQAPAVDLNGGGAGSGNAVSYTENGSAVSLVDATATLTDGDSANMSGATIQITNAQTGDALSLNGYANGATFNGITITYTSASLITLSGSGTAADYLTLIKAAQFVNSSELDNTTTRSVAVTVTDSESHAGTAATASVAVTAVNDAPSLSGNMTLAAVNEDTTNPAGATIASLALGLYSDPDSASQTSPGGLAIIGNSANASTQGEWQYSTDGATWYTIATVGDDATALALSATTSLRFVPVADYNGTPPALSVRALDASYGAGWTSGATRVTVNTSAPGGSTAIDATARSVGTSITAVNDAPVLAANTGLTVAEGSTNTVIENNPNLRVDDVEQSAANRTFTVETAPANGTLYKNGVALSAHDTFTQADIDSSLITYSHNGGETISDSFTFTVSDGAGGSIPATTFAITVTPVNDAPSVATNTGLTVSKGTATAITTTQLNEGDPDDAGTGLTYTVTTAATHGSVWIDADGSGTINGAEAALGVGGSFTQQDIIDGKVKYLHDNGVDGADSFVFTLADGGENGAAAVTNQTFNFTIVMAPETDLNGGSAGTGNTVTYTENGSAVSLVDAAATLTDGDSANMSGATIQITAGGEAGDALSLNGYANGATFNGITITYTSASLITLSGPGTAADYLTLIKAAQFSSTSDQNAADRTVTVIVTDSESHAGPAASATVAVTAINDAPTGSVTAANPGFTENGAAQALFSAATLNTVETGQNFASAIITVGNLADGSAEKLVVGTTQISLTAGASGTTSNGIAYTVAVTGSTATVTLTKADTAANWQGFLTGVKYENTSDNPTTTGGRTVTLVSVTDAGGTANGGVATTAIGTASTVTLTAVNDSPGMTTGPGNVQNGNTLIITSAILNETDPDDSGAGVTYTLTAAPTGGTLSKNGVVLANGDSFTQADIDAGLISFTPSGIGTANFSVSLADGGADGSTPATGTVSISVTAADVPTPAPAPAPPAPPAPPPPEPAPLPPEPPPVVVAPPPPPTIQPAPIVIAEAPTLTKVSPAGGFAVAVMSNTSSSLGDGLAVNRGMQDTAVAIGGRTVIGIPVDAFAHSDPNAVVQLAATQADGKPLPPWVAFDPKTGKFTIQPPAGAKGVFNIRVVARDDQGREAITTFKVVVGNAQTGDASDALDRDGNPIKDSKQAFAGKPGLMAQMKTSTLAGRLAAGKTVLMEAARAAART